MKSKVTDPSILAQLNSGSKKVTDPALLAQLNAEPAVNENLFQKIIRYGIKDPAIGVLNMGREFANLPHKVSGGHIPELSPSDYDFAAMLGLENPDAADKLLQFAGQYGPSLAIPGVGLGRAGQVIGNIPKVGRFATKALSEAIPQGLYSAAQAPQNNLKAGAQAAATQIPFSVLAELMQGTSPVVRGLAKTGMGIGGAYLSHEAAKHVGLGETGSDIAAVLGGAFGARGFGSTNDMMKRLTQGVNPKIAGERLAAAERLGLDYLTPAEAGVNPWAAKRQGALGRTEEGGQMLIERGKKRQESERQAINKVLDKIYTQETMAPKIKEAYEKMAPVNMPKEFPLQYRDNAIIKEAEHMVKTVPAYQESLKKLLPENVKLKLGQTEPLPTSLVYWDHVKRALDDMVSKAERAGNNNEARIISNTRAEMRDQMDTHFPEYAEARSLYERKMVRKGLEKVFDRKEVNGQNFYQALASQNKFDQLIGHLKNAPDAVQNLKDMRLIFKDLMGPPTIRTAKGTEERGMNQARNPGNYLEHILEHAFTKGVNDEAAIRFITSKDWAKQMEGINKIADKHLKSVAFGLALSKGISQAAGKQDKKL